MSNYSGYGRNITGIKSLKEHSLFLACYGESSVLFDVKNKSVFVVKCMFMHMEGKMSATEVKISDRIQWYNNEVVIVQENFRRWLADLGYEVTVEEQVIEKNEELSGAYTTKRFDFTLGEGFKVSLIPYAIWIIGAKGRIDISGPSGTEKLLYFFTGGPGMSMKIHDGNSVEKSSYRYFEDVDEDAWYWYDDSSYRKVAKFSKEIVIPLLERLQ